MAERGEGIAITRVFDAPIELVWKEWTEPKRFADWFGGTEADIPLSTVSMDVREGGRWKATMYFGPDRHEIHWHGEYREVVDPTRLVLTITDQPDEARELVTVVLNDLGDGRTEMHFEQRGGGLSDEQYGHARDGWSTFFDSMAARLTG